MTSGFFCIDKPKGITSHNVISRMRRILNMKKIGHAGTLDPMATGVLMVGIGTSTRLLDYVQAGIKEYVATIKFGEATDTGDAEGELITTSDMSDLTESQLQSATEKFVGKIEQIPPMVSAIKVDGKKLYEYAREGKEIERKKRSVFIESILLEDFKKGVNPVATIRVRCSAGTYIRTLAEDIADALGGVAHLIQLRRTSNGTINEDQCISLDELENANDPFEKMLQPQECLKHLKCIELDQAQTEYAKLGKFFTFDEMQLNEIEEVKNVFYVYTPENNFIGVYEKVIGKNPKLKCNIFY